jgi:ankyrin repeat protein
MVVLLLEAGADANKKAHSQDRTPLHVAAVSGQAGPVRALLAAGARVDARDEHGRTALELAESLDRRGAEIARILREAGAD